MSRIDDALRRLTGSVPPEPRKPQTLDGFASEGDVSHRDDSRRPGKNDRKLTPFVVASSAPVEPRPVAPMAPPAPTRPVAVADPVMHRTVERFEPEPDAEKLIDFRQVADYAGFVVRSLGRHKAFAVGTFLAVVVVAALVAVFLPRTYFVEVTLLAQRNAVMAALSNPGRAVPWDADAPTRAAAETVLRRDNLISLITQTDAINEWDRRRPVLVRLKDWATEKVTGYQLTPEDKLDLLIWRLETYMFVDAGPVGDGTVTIQLYWPDAEMAYRIVERARLSFLEARQAAETSAISESIQILEGYSQTLHDKVNRTLTDVRTRPTSATGDAPVQAVARPRRALPLAPTFDPLAGITAAPDAVAPNPEVARVANLLRGKEEELKRIEDTRQQELANEQAKLGALKTVYTGSHPSVENQQQKVDGLQAASPQAVALQKQVADLEARYEALSTADTERIEKENAARRASAPVARAARPAEPTTAEPAPAAAPRVDPAAEFANLTFRTELSQLQSILERIDGAKIELAVSEAAFKYRYTVIKPAQVPREPQSPNLRLLAVLGLFAALVLAVGAAVAKDLISNRIVEAWQVERQLGLPILGSVRLV